MEEIKRISKYGIVGVVGTIIDLALLFVLVDYFQVSLIKAVTTSFILAATNNFVWNKIWTFRNRNKAYHHQYIKFFIVSAVGLAFTLMMMYILNILLGLWYILAKIVTSLFVLSWNYCGNKYWTFKLHKKIDLYNRRHLFDYSIIIPAYNEEKRILSTLFSIEKFLSTFDKKCEIIVVNDGSKDETAKVLGQFRSTKAVFKIINLPKNQGKGHAVKTGVLNSNGQYVLFTDADNSTQIEELWNLEKYIGTYDIVIGSRKLTTSIIAKNQPSYRKLISDIGSVLSTTLIKDIRDTQCGFKLIKSQIAKEVFNRQTIKRFGFDLEFLAISQYYDFKIIEVPIRWTDVRGSRFRPIYDTFLTLCDFFVIQYNFLRKKY